MENSILEILTYYVIGGNADENRGIKTLRMKLRILVLLAFFIALLLLWPSKDNEKINTKLKKYLCI